MIDRTSNQHSDHIPHFVPRDCGWWVVRCIFLWTGNPLNLHLWFSLIPQFFQQRTWAKITCNCGGNCLDHYVKQMETMIMCHALAGKTRVTFTKFRFQDRYGAISWKIKPMGWAKIWHHSHLTSHWSDFQDFVSYLQAGILWNYTQCAKNMPKQCSKQDPNI